WAEGALPGVLEVGGGDLFSIGPAGVRPEVEAEEAMIIALLPVGGDALDRVGVSRIGGGEALEHLDDEGGARAVGAPAWVEELGLGAVVDVVGGDVLAGAGTSAEVGALVPSAAARGGHAEGNEGRSRRGRRAGGRPGRRGTPHAVGVS